jgi:hypothetical protein
LVERLALRFGAVPASGVADHIRTVEDLVELAQTFRNGPASQPEAPAAPWTWSPSEIQVQRPPHR